VIFRAPFSSYVSAAVEMDSGLRFYVCPQTDSRVIQRWLKVNGIKTIYIESGCPWQNGYAESFNGRFRRECLNRELIYTLSEGRVVFED